MSDWPELEELLPHRNPMILLDRMVDYTPTSIHCELTLRDDSTFVQNGRVRGVVCLEWMAQSVAAFVGETRRRQGQRPCLGYVVASRNLELQTRSFAVGVAYQVKATLKWLDGNGGQFDCQVLEGEQTLASCPLTVFQTETGGLPV